MDETGHREVKWSRAFLIAFGLVASTVFRVDAQEVSGVVLDHVTGTPIRGATVHLLSANHELLGSASTDARGRYSLRSPGAGEFLLLAEVVGYSNVLSPTLSVMDGTTTHHDFRIPTLVGAAAEPVQELDSETLAQALAVICGPRYDSETEGILVGVVRDSVSNLPLPEVTTRLEWGDEGRVKSREIVTGDDGSFVFCEAPVGPSRQLRAEIVGVVAVTEAFDVNPGMIKRKDVFLNLSNANRPGDVLGLITDFATGDPVTGAEVGLRGTSFSTLTGEFGGFAFSDVPWGV